jgi:hypothetical protein
MIKPVKAWAVVTMYGRLRNYATRYRRQAEEDLCFGDTVIPVLITPIERSAKRGKASKKPRRKSR